jgi:hypothetical protein
LEVWDKAQMIRPFFCISRAGSVFIPIRFHFFVEKKIIIIVSATGCETSKNPSLKVPSFLI